MTEMREWGHINFARKSFLEVPMIPLKTFPKKYIGECMCVSGFVCVCVRVFVCLYITFNFLTKEGATKIHVVTRSTANQITHFKEATLANMATVMSSSDADASGASADDSEGTSSGFCCMHVIATHSRVIPLAEKSFKKFKECANLWKEIENTPESKVAHNADRYGWDCVSAAEAPAKQPRHVDDDDERSGRRKRGTPGYHAECYRHFCNITEINRAIRRNKRQKGKIYQLYFCFLIYKNKKKILQLCFKWKTKNQILLKIVILTYF
uniref:uncharacterized protein n=1 Tax=Myxine glutinosa TaxID=7769 RepID=UPI00358ED424